MKDLPDIFVPDHTLELSAGRFNHCSTVCPHRGGLLVGWYSGTGECRDDQSVTLLFIQGRDISTPYRLGDKTGNPVLWRNDNRAILLYSRFEDTGPVIKLADRWKYCSLWLQALYWDGEIHLDGEPIRLSDQHLLGRCGPVRRGDDLLLPLYDEVERHGVLFIGKGLNFRRAGSIGHHMIQPTLWLRGQTICSLSRTFHSLERHAPYAESRDGERWSPPAPSGLKNNNSSLHVLPWCNHLLVAWNDTESSRRERLSMGTLTLANGRLDAKPLSVVGLHYGAYPFLCQDEGKTLHLTFTTELGKIRYHAWSRQTFQTALRQRLHRSRNPTRR